MERHFKWALPGKSERKNYSWKSIVTLSSSPPILFRNGISRSWCTLAREASDANTILATDFGCASQFMLKGKKETCIHCFGSVGHTGLYCTWYWGALGFGFSVSFFFSFAFLSYLLNVSVISSRDVQFGYFQANFAVSGWLGDVWNNQKHSPNLKSDGNFSPEILGPFQIFWDGRSGKGEKGWWYKQTAVWQRLILLDFIGPLFLANSQDSREIWNSPAFLWVSRWVLPPPKLAAQAVTRKKACCNTAGLMLSTQVWGCMSPSFPFTFVRRHGGR